MLDLTSILSSVGSVGDTPPNVVEVYICPEQVHLDHEITVGWKSPITKNFQMGQGHTSRFHDYFHRDLTYSYDRENDAQRVVRRSIRHEAVEKNLYIACYEEEMLPSHRFPCTDEIAHECDITRTSYRINNRMYLYHDKEDGYEYMYVRYQHAPNVDIKQMQFDLQRILRKLT